MGRTLIWLLPLCAVASPASAEDRRITQSPHTEHSELIAGLKAIYVDEHAEEQRERGVGLAVFMEMTLVEHLLELELGVAGVLPEESAAQLALEPLLKTNFNVAEAVDPYIGVGPVLLYGAEPPRFRAGGQLVVGSYLWLHPTFGFDVDTGFALLSGAVALTWELTVTTGPVLRF